MSNCFEISDGKITCHKCRYPIPLREQYIWFDHDGGENWCMKCVYPQPTGEIRHEP